MAVALKKIAEQVVVITGATSGVGLVTARQAAQRGARLVLAARNETALKQLGSTFELISQDLGPFALDFASNAGIASAIGVLGFNGDNVDTSFDLLETQGLLRTLAEPNLLAV